MQIRGVLHTIHIIYGHESPHLFILTSIHDFQSWLSVSHRVSLSVRTRARGRSFLRQGYQSYLLKLMHALSTHLHPGTSRAQFRKQIFWYYLHLYEQELPTALTPTLLPVQPSMCHGTHHPQTCTLIEPQGLSYTTDRRAQITASLLLKCEK